jgi:Ethanolamine utilization protein EutJ (predicted chaperonin)
VRVVDGAASVTSRAKDAAPVIDTFAVSPEAVAVNECVVVSWNVGGDVKTIQILRDDAVILDGAPTTGSGQNCLTEAGSYRFSLVATSSTGQSSQRRSHRDRGDGDAGSAARRRARPTRR